MGRPKLDYEPIKVELRCSPKLVAYLEDLKSEEGYGNSRPTVAEALVWRGIEELISRGLLTRRAGKMTKLPEEYKDGE